MVLPIAGLGQFLDFATNQAFLDRAQVVDIENAVEMVDFMTETSGQQSLGLDDNLFTMNVLPTDDHLFGSNDSVGEVGYAQAAFFAFLFPFGRHDFGIADRDELTRVLADRQINGSQTYIQTDLRCGQAYAGGTVHGLNHVLNELFQFAVEVIHGQAQPLQLGLPVL